MLIPGSVFTSSSRSEVKPNMLVAISLWKEFVKARVTYFASDLHLVCWRRKFFHGISSFFCHSSLFSFESLGIEENCVGEPVREGFLFTPTCERRQPCNVMSFIPPKADPGNGPT